MMKSEEDKEFLLKQRERGRPGCMLGVDLKLAPTEERKLQKERAKINQQVQTECLFDIGTLTFPGFNCYFYKSTSKPR